MLDIAKLKDGVATMDVAFHKGIFTISAIYGEDANFNRSAGANTHIAGEPQ